MKKQERINLIYNLSCESNISGCDRNHLPGDPGITGYAALPLGSKSDLINSPEFALAIYTLLKNRDINPTGTFDKQGRWYAHNSHLISVRRPSASYPYSEMTACRTLKYVRAVIDDNHKDILNARNPFAAACHLV